MKNLLLNIIVLSMCIFILFVIIEFFYQENIQSDMMKNEEDIEYYIVTNYGKYFEDVQVSIQQLGVLETTKNIDVTFTNYKDKDFDEKKLKEIMDSVGNILNSKELDIIYPENYGEINVSVFMKNTYNVSLKDVEKKTFANKVSNFLNRMLNDTKEKRDNENKDTKEKTDTETNKTKENSN